MNAKIVCKKLDIDKLEEAFVLSGYDETDTETVLEKISYKIYQNSDSYIIAFDSPFSFINLFFLVSDLYEVSRDNLEKDICGFVDLDVDSKITAHLDGPRVGIYISEELKIALKENEDKYLDMMDIVTQSNKNSAIGVTSFFAFNSPDKRTYNEAEIDLNSFELIREGEYLFEDDTAEIEQEYLDDMRSENN